VNVISPAVRPNLAGMSLLVPGIQLEPLPISAITPAPCTQACPAGVNVKAYVSLIAEGRFAESLEVIRRRCPLPGICGRICHHPCELACRRGRSDEALAIRSLKRFVADRERELPRPSAPPGSRHPERVAVIGSGPAGLTAAYDLRLAGYGVTVYEGDDEPGGMLRYGIASYRLPRDVLDAEIEVLVRAGVEIRTGRRLGGELEIERLIRDGDAAVLLAVGAQHGRRLGVPGDAGTPQVEDALRFLRRANAGAQPPIEGRVVVIGGGSTAIEAARTALRLGARSVEILYRRYREELRAGLEEVEAAEAEGVRFRFLVAPKRVVTRGRELQALECLRVGLGEPDSSCRRRPILIPGSEFRVEVDLVLAAVGQEADLDFLTREERDHLSNRGLLRTDPDTAMTEAGGVFAAGDAVSGPATVIEAIAAGHAAAESIRHYITEGAPDIREQRPERSAALEYELPDPVPVAAPRAQPFMVRPEPGDEFAEVERAFSADAAISEARRCLRCGPCGECQVCTPSCSRRHVMLRFPSENGAAAPATAIVRAPASFALALSVEAQTEGLLRKPTRSPGLSETPELPASLRPVRARIREERCRGCGLCTEICPFEAVELKGDASDRRAHIEAALCRGCNLCTTVCPTHAASASALSAEWWGERLEDVVQLTPSGDIEPGVSVVLACQRRAGSLEGVTEAVEVIRFRCVGQVHAGMLVELYRLGTRRIVVAGCEMERCRFGGGARLAAREVERAQALLRLAGADPQRISTDWSADRAHDPLKLVAASVAGDRESPGHGHQERQ